MNCSYMSSKAVAYTELSYVGSLGGELVYFLQNHCRQVTNNLEKMTYSLT